MKKGSQLLKVYYFQILKRCEKLFIFFKKFEIIPESIIIGWMQLVIIGFLFSLFLSLKSIAKTSVGISFAKDAFSVKINQLIQQIIFIENQIRRSRKANLNFVF